MASAGPGGGALPTETTSHHVWIPRPGLASTSRAVQGKGGILHGILLDARLQGLHLQSWPEASILAVPCAVPKEGLPKTTAGKEGHETPMQRWHRGGRPRGPDAGLGGAQKQPGDKCGEA